MSNDLTTNAPDDGWNDAAAEAAERMIRGTLLKFADRAWTAGKESVPVEVGTELAAVATAAAWIRWQGGKPVEILLRQPGTRMPDIEEMPDRDQTKWEVGPDGEPKDPWANTRFVYLIHPTTAEAFTFTTSSGGGRSAVSDLGDTIGRMRRAHPGAVPIVSLQVAPMKTKFGMKSKPAFKIVGWKSSDGEPIQQPKRLPPQPGGGALNAQRDDNMSDQIPF